MLFSLIQVIRLSMCLPQG